jgi:hypothetical protein
MSNKLKKERDKEKEIDREREKIRKGKTGNKIQSI